MKQVFRGILVFMIAAISFNCQKELSGSLSTVPVTPNSGPSPITATLQGNVVDETGKPAPGAKVLAGNQTAVTNAKGYFRITNASLDKNTSVAIIEQPGYFRAYRSFRATSGTNQVVIKLVKKNLAGTVNAATGGEAALSNGAKISLQANGIINPSGGAYAGSVQVFAAYIDPTAEDIGKTVPGSFMADDKNQNRVALSSYGMLAVELESVTGEKLQVATGSTATLTTPIPASLAATAPASIKLWYIDEQSGIWKEQGNATKTGNNYRGQVQHFSYWNCDAMFPAVFFSAVLKTADGNFLKNASVRIKRTGAANPGIGYGYTDSLGQTSGLVPSGEAMVLDILDDCYNVVYTKNIGPYSADADAGTIVIPNSVASSVTIKGKLLSCDNSPVRNGYAIVNWHNYVNYVSVDKEGNFSTGVIVCSGSPQTMTITGVDAAAVQQGNLLTIPVNSQTTDVGNVIACGVSSAQFIKYTIDGMDHDISSAANDSLIAYSYADTLLSSGTAFVTYIGGANTANNTALNFNFTSSGMPGTYVLSTLNALPYNDIVLSRPFNVTVTAYPAYPGGFFEGNFSGSFVNSGSAPVVHQITCSFRIRKY